MARPVPIAVFVSPHGYGHAARTCAIIQALFELEPAARFEVFTLVPEWFFLDSLACPFRYHILRTDVGLVQTTALAEDPHATLALLEDFLLFKDDLVDRLATELRDLSCGLMLADISPLGIAAARHAGIPSALIENFTWDWIYGAYLDAYPAFEGPIAVLTRLFEAADLRIQTEPVCRPVAGAVTVPPVSRTPRTGRDEVRRRLAIPAEARMVLVTMGGTPWQHASLARLETFSHVIFVIPGTADSPERRGSLVALPHRSGHYHPDLVHASDAIVGKLGYSTLAETYAAAVPFGYAPRPTFRESAPLASFIGNRMAGLEVTPEELYSGSWPARVPELLALGRPTARRENGARAAARLLLGLLRGSANLG